jgi:hypothetical protein
MSPHQTSEHFLLSHHTHFTTSHYWALSYMQLYTFLHNLLNVLVQIAIYLRQSVTNYGAEHYREISSC